MPRVIVCPNEHCRKSIRLPDQIQAEASLRCPICKNMFKLACTPANYSVFIQTPEGIRTGFSATPLPESQASSPVGDSPAPETVSRLEQQTSDPLHTPPADEADTPRGTVSFVPGNSEEVNLAILSTQNLPAATPIAGQVGRFRLRRILGEGAFGKVYEAFDPQLDRVVAIKVAKLDRGDAGQRLKRFLREAKAAANLRHPHIVPLYEFGEVGDQFYLTLAYIEGATLAETIHAQKDSPNKEFRQAATIVLHLAEALAYAHGQDIVHRDIKPANVMLDANGEPLLMDFGLATWPQDEKLTVEGSVMGTPAYMAPEQCRGETSPASDQYSLGVTLFQLVTGQTPFKGPIDRQIYHHIHTEPPPPRSINRLVPGDLETICLKCLEKEPSRRFANCQALADDLQRWLQGEPIQARPVGPVEKLGKWARRKPGVASLAALVLVVALAGFGAVLYQLGQTTDALALASTNASKFETASILAKANEEEAISALKLASQERQNADKARIRAQEEAAEAKRNLYVANIGLASQALESGDVVAARNLLKAVAPNSEDDDFRGFEWHYFWRQCHLDHEVLGKPQGHIRSVTLSPDGKTLVMAGGFGSKGEATVWDFETRKEIGGLTGFKGIVNTAVISPDGAHLATGEGSLNIPGEIKIWSLADRKLITSFGAGPDAIMSLAFSPDSKTLVSGTVSFAQSAGSPADRFLHVSSHPRQGGVKLWSFSTGKELATFPGETGHIFAVAYAPDGSTVATGNAAGDVTLWDPVAREKIGNVRGNIPYVWSLVFSPDSTLLAGGVGIWNGPGEAKVWETPTKNQGTIKEIAAFRGHHGGVPALAFSPDGKRLAFGGFDRLIRVMDLAKRLELATIPGHSGYIWSLAYSRDGRTLVSGSWDVQSTKTTLGEVKLWKLNRAQRFAKVTIPGLSAYDHAAWHGKLRVFQDQAKAIMVEDAETGSVVVKLRGGLDGSGGIRCLAFSPDGTKIAASGFSLSTRVFDAEEGTLLWELKTNSVPNLLFSPNGRFLATAGDDGVARLWELSTGRELHTLSGHTDIIWSLAFTPDSQRLATGSWDRTVKIWDTSRGTLLATLKGLQGVAWKTRFVNDGKTLVVGAGGHVGLWDGSSPQLDQPIGTNLPDPGNEEGYYMAGLAYLTLGRIADAENAYRNARRILESGGTLNPRTKNLVSALFSQLVNLGESKEVRRVQQRLTAQDPKDPKTKSSYKEFFVPLAAGRNYAIDLVSDHFDAFLRFEDSKGRLIAEDDDGGGNLNSAIFTVVPRNDTYRIVVTSFDGKLGDFTLSVRELMGRPKTAD